VYSSAPLRGDRSAEAIALSNGIRLALEQAGGRAGRLRVRYRPLDNSARPGGPPSPEAAADNARNVARDDDAVAYIGELDEGSSISIPVSNEGGIAQIGTADTAVGLTTNEAGANPGEPQKFYPSTKRTFVRIVPRDTIQGAALVSLARRSGCTKLAIVNDGTRFGTGLALSLQAAGRLQRLEIGFEATIDPHKTSYRSQARRARLSGVDCFAFAGLPSSAPTRVYRDFGAALADADLFGPDRLAVASFTDPDAGGVSARLGERIRLTVSTLPPDYPADAKRFVRRYERIYDAEPLPSALYGYEAMRLVLEAIGRSGDGDRAAVIRELYETKDRESVLGSYSVDPNGDTSRVSFGVCSIIDGTLRVDGSIRAEVAQ